MKYKCIKSGSYSNLDFRIGEFISEQTYNKLSYLDRRNFVQYKEEDSSDSSFMAGLVTGLIVDSLFNSSSDSSFDSSSDSSSFGGFGGGDFGGGGSSGDF